MDANLELARTKLTLNHLARYSELADAERLLSSLRETVTFLERRIAREKLSEIKLRAVLSSNADDFREPALTT